MKKHIIISIAILSTFISCKKEWLEIVPQGEQIVTTTDDYDKLMNDPTLYLQLYGGGYQEPQLMGDEVAAETSYFINIGVVRSPLFQWKDAIYTIPSLAPLTLTQTLSQMYQVNKVINEVMNSDNGTEQRKKEIRAEALATRAWNMFILANYYCKPYAASSATTDPGFPLLKDANVNLKQFPRGTLQQTYDFIISDFKEALLSISTKPTIVTRMSKPAVEGMLGKVYLFMGRNSDALPLLKAALNDVAANGQTSLYDYNIEFAPGGGFLPIDQYSGPNSPGQRLSDTREAVVSKIFYSGSFTGNQFGNNGLVLTPKASALYGARDLRLLLYTNRNPDNSPNAGGRLRKYGVAYSRYGLQLSELYLLNAECKARTNDLAGAVADLETLRRTRIMVKDELGNPINDAIVPAEIAGDQTALIKFIIDERIREFAMEGYRWFDMRRLSVDPLFAGITFTHTMYNQDGSTTVYTLNQPNRLVLRLPQYIMDANPDLINNP